MITMVYLLIKKANSSKKQDSFFIGGLKEIQERI